MLVLHFHVVHHSAVKFRPDSQLWSPSRRLSRFCLMRVSFPYVFLVMQLKKPLFLHERKAFGAFSEVSGKADGDQHDRAETLQRRDP